MNSNALHILVAADVPPNPNSGAAGTVYATNVALRALGHHVDEVWSSDLPHRIEHWNLHYLLELPRAYRDVVRRRSATREPDVVQISQPHAWLAAKEHRNRRARGVFVNRSHGLESMADAAMAHWQKRLGVTPNRFPRSWFSPVIQRALHRHIDLTVRYADGIIVPAADIREHLIREHGASPDRVAVIHHGVPDAFIDTPRPQLTESRLKRVLHVGQYAFIKGPQLMATAVQDALAVDADLCFTWVCDVAHHAEALQLFLPEFRGRVTMHAWVDQQALMRLYDSHGIFVAHSIYEGAAKACTEAMARGLVVVSSAVGALKDHAHADAYLRVVDVGDTVRMTNELLSLSSDVALARDPRSQAPGFFDSFRWRQCALNSVAFYSRLHDLRVQGC